MHVRACATGFPRMRADDCTHVSAAAGGKRGGCGGLPPARPPPPLHLCRWVMHGGRMGLLPSSTAAAILPLRPPAPAAALLLPTLLLPLLLPCNCLQTTCRTMMPRGMGCALPTSLRHAPRPAGGPTTACPRRRPRPRPHRTSPERGAPQLAPQPALLVAPIDVPCILACGFVNAHCRHQLPGGGGVSMDAGSRVGCGGRGILQARRDLSRFFRVCDRGSVCKVLCCCTRESARIVLGTGPRPNEHLRCGAGLAAGREPEHLLGD